MKKNPITFELNGKLYSGTLDEVAGAGGGVWHLMVENYYWGRLRKVEGLWHFDENKAGAGVNAIKECFIEVLNSHYK